jgi:hypothetical protein
LVRAFPVKSHAAPASPGIAINRIKTGAPIIEIAIFLLESDRAMKLGTAYQ